MLKVPYIINTMLKKNISGKGQELLLGYMRKNKLKRKDMAEKYKISQAFLSYYFNGKRSLGKMLALEISKDTGISLEILIQ